MLPSELNQKYELRGTLGAGAMGIVYDAVDRFLGREVAIKIVKRQKAVDAEGIEAEERFRREARSVGRFTHPNIVLVYDYGENAEQAWIIMEKVEGGSLKERLDRRDRFSTAEIVRIMDEILRGLGYAHANGIAAHRDVKPANIMLTRDGTVKIADFGIARLQNSGLTQLGQVLGTPAYMAPEQFEKSAAVDHRADLWAAGIVLYQLLTGEKPFEGNDFLILAHRIRQTEPPPPSQLSVTIPRAFDAVIGHALAKRPDERFQTAAAFAEAIRTAATPQAMPAAPPPLPAMNSDATVISTGIRGGLPPLPGLGPSTGPASAAAAPGPGTGQRPAPPKPPNPKSDGAGGSRMAIFAGIGVAGLAVAAGAAWFFWPESSREVVVVVPAPQPPGPQPPGPGPQPPGPGPQPPGPGPHPPGPGPQPPGPGPQPPGPGPQPPGPGPVPPPDTPTRPSGLDLRAAGQAAVQTNCSLLSWSATDQTLSLSGVLRRNDVASLGRMLVGRGIPDSMVRLQLQPFDGPYCDALEIVRPVLGGFGTAPTATLLGDAPLAAGERIRIDIEMPPWPAFLYVGYLDSSGNVAHLVTARQMRAGERFVLGETEAYTAEAPFGTDMAVVVASERPLFGPERLSDNLAEFLPVLSRGLSSQLQVRSRIAMRPVIIETVERRR